jgi:hypothetical protein
MGYALKRYNYYLLYNILKYNAANLYYLLTGMIPVVPLFIIFAYDAALARLHIVRYLYLDPRFESRPGTLRGLFMEL